MRHLFTLFFGSLFFLSLWSCTNTPAEKPSSPVYDDPIEETTEQEEVKNTETKVEASNNSITATYESASMYAASTAFYFKTSAGETIEVWVSNETEGRMTKIPANMMENIEEDLPDANPAKVGKSFQLIYKAGQVIEIRE